MMSKHTTGRWVAFSEKLPPFSAASDDASVTSADYVLVTNNINARDRMGRMSHVWFARPHCSNDGWVAYMDGSYLKMENLTHWYDPFDGLSASVPELLAALEEISVLMLCGKKDQLPGRCERASKIALKAIAKAKGE